MKKEYNIVDTKFYPDKNEVDYDNDVIYFDLETFQETNYHIPYACGWFDGEYIFTYGIQDDKGNPFDVFIDQIIGVNNKKITAYNGSGFDFYFMIDKLTDRNITVENIIINNGKVLSFKFGENNKVFYFFIYIIVS